MKKFMNATAEVLNESLRGFAAAHADILRLHQHPVFVTRAAAAAEDGADLAACKALGERINEATRSMGVALTSCTVPAAGRPTFDIGETEMELGVGIHGEPGRRRVALAPADEIAHTMMEAITA